MMNTFKYIRIFSLLASATLMSSCLKDQDIRTEQDELKELSEYLVENNIVKSPTWTGLYFLEDSAGTGEYPVFGDTVVIGFEGRLLDGTLLASSSVNGEPADFVLWDWQSGIIPGLFEAVSYMKPGGIATAIIPSALAFGGNYNDVIKPYSTLVYDLELLEVMPGIPVEPYSTEGLSSTTTSSGLEYYVIEATDSTKVPGGAIVSVHYTGYLYNGNIFDSSVKRGRTSEFTVGTGSLITGFDEGLQLMRVGEKYRFIIPPELAYGSNGSFPVIPPDEELTFDVELIGFN